VKIYSYFIGAIVCLGISNLHAKIEIRQYPSSFALECDDKTSKLHLIPLSFYEFQDDPDVKNLKSGYIESLVAAAPITFKSFKSEFAHIALIEHEMVEPVLERYDPLLVPPKGCRVIAMTTTSGNSFKKIEVNKKYWNSLPETLKYYFLFETYIQNYLSTELAVSDYRRFDFYFATDIFDKLSDDQKIYFLQYHGITEFLYSGVSIDLGREFLFFEDSRILRDAYPFKGATFEMALIDQRKFITFTKNRKIFELATNTPFTRRMNGQDFEFYIPENLTSSNYPPDIRYGPRLRFFSNGNVQFGLIKAVNHFFDLKKNIQNSWDNNSYKKIFFKVEFYSDQNPSCLISYPGDIEILEKKYLVVKSCWWNNQKLKEVYFTDRHEFYVPGMGKVNALGLFFNEEEKIKGYL
jgi:hypothetical protein